jgi:hypothetical protein
VSISVTGLVTVTGVATGTESTVTVTTAQTGYAGGSAASTHSAAAAPALATAAPTAAPTEPLLEPAVPNATEVSTYTSSVTLPAVALTGLTLTQFQQPAVQLSVRKGFAREFQVRPRARLASLALAVLCSRPVPPRASRGHRLLQKRSL